MNRTQFANLIGVMAELPTEYLHCWARGNHRWDVLKEVQARYGWDVLEYCDTCNARRRSDINHWNRVIRRGGIEYAQPEVYRVSKREGVDLGDATVWDLRGAATAVLRERREQAA